MDIGFYKTYFEVEKTHWFMRVRRLLATDMLVRFSMQAPSQNKILDFGSGSGILIDELAHKGFETYGTDVSAEAIQFGTMKGIKNLSVQTLPNKIDFPDNTFDTVFSLDVLEHIEDAGWAIREIERVLKPGGIFISMVPAYMFLWGVQDEVAYHFRRYTMGSLIAEIQKNSALRVEFKSYFNTLLFPLIAAVRLVSRWFHLKGRESDFDINNPFLDKLFFAIFNFERTLLRIMRLPFGVSVLLVVRKK